MKKLNKKFLMIMFMMLLFVNSVLPVCAAGDLPRLVDVADLLSDSEEEELLSKLDEISERQEVDIVIVTVDSLEGESVVDYADDFYDYYDYGFGSEKDGILFLISMEERDWCISTRGYGIYVVTDAGLEYMAGFIISDLSEGNYAAAFTTFAELCDDYIVQAATGEPYDVDNLPQEPFAFGMSFVISFGVAFVIALIVTGIMRGQLKSVHSERAADNYVKAGSMHLTRKNDLFLYRRIDRREKPKEDSSSSSGGSSTHTSSSGATHGGGSGKF